MFSPRRDSSCSLCPLAEGAQTVCVVEQPQNEQLLGMIVAEAPGRNEDLLGAPLVGKAGKLLNEALVQGGLAREQFYATNTVRCRPPENRTPEAEEVLACSTYLLADFHALNPEFILLLGNTALESYTNRQGISRNRGEIRFPDHLFWMFPEDEFGRSPRVFATFHPAAALYSAQTKQTFFEDIVSFCHEVEKASSPTH